MNTIQRALKPDDHEIDIRKRGWVFSGSLLAGIFLWVLLFNWGVEDFQRNRDSKDFTVGDTLQETKLKGLNEKGQDSGRGLREAAPPLSSPSGSKPKAGKYDIIEGTIKKGQTVSSLLGSLLTPGEIHLLSEQSKSIYPLHKIKVGQPYIIRTLNGAFHSYEYEIDRNERVIVRAKKDKGFGIAVKPIIYDETTAVVKGVITSSLYEAVEEVGEEPELAMKLSDIFGWDIDFILDIRQGDSFSAVIEKRYRKGVFHGYGHILAAEFINQGNKFQGFLYRDENGQQEYYDFQGNNLRKAFLKAPLKNFRITSGFSWRRFHPIKHIWRPHLAIDYAAPVGTPVYTVGDGVVMAMSQHKNNGKYIKIRHNSVYETYYLHLSKFAKGLRKGKKVSQGQIIGFVGSTGMSTGPHLDFRMKKNGKYVDHRKIKAPREKALPKEKLTGFQYSVKPLLAQLASSNIITTSKRP